jgi:hypothetical protein
MRKIQLIQTCLLIAAAQAQTSVNAKERVAEARKSYAIAMSRHFFCLFVMAFSLLGMMSCKQSGNVTAGEETDSVDVVAEKAEVEEVGNDEAVANVIDVEKYWDTFQEKYEEDDLDDIHYPLTKYAFIDIDEDGIKEVWVRTENDEDGAIFGFDEEGFPQLIITESEGKRPSIGKGWVGIGYPAGGPSYFNHYVIVTNSTKETQLTDFQVYENHEYYQGDTEITEAEAKELMKRIKGEGLALNPEWHKRVNK